ncbi:MAG: methylmalonyl Co-A mutase-associated GTPase MeaB [Acidobacteriaceae bacterium]
MIADVNDAEREGLGGAGEGASVGEVMARLRAGDVRALARAISAVEDGVPGAGELMAACRAVVEEVVAAGGLRAVRVGVTGPPGAGKSTLIDAMVRGWRERGKTVGVVAVDPTSPYTGGALLGDRLRMQGFAGDEGVYFRSMASRGGAGGVAAAVGDVCAVMEAAGREVVVIETVGAGQDEVAVARVADVVMVVLAPGMGDAVQSEKAGMMEIADVFVVNKADCDGAERMEGEIREMQGLGARAEGWVAPVVRTVATTGVGVGGLMEAVERCVGERGAGSEARRRVEGFVGGGAELDHVGIAVRSIAGARGFYEALGLVVGREEVVEQEAVWAAMIRLGGTRLELLEARQEDSVIGRFVAKRGEGLHHIAVRVGDVDGAFARMRAEGVRLVSDGVRVGAGGHRYFFVHPASAGGVLVEVVGEARAR